MAWFDIGVNLLDSRFDPAEIIHNAEQQGVNRLCVITTHPDEWELAADLYTKFPDRLCYTVGVHPHNAKSMRPEHWPELRQRASAPGVVAIGECGLDYNRDFSPRDVQRDVFEQQLKLAGELGMPVYLHERDAFDDQITLLDSHLDSIPAGVLHCFTAGRIELEQYVKRGLYIGVTGWVCDDKRGEALRDAVPAIPMERLLLETDAPYLFPKTLRPRKRNNEPAYLPHIATEVAKLRGMAQNELREVSYRNACRLFGLNE